jgi:hypothetical protein
MTSPLTIRPASSGSAPPQAAEPADATFGTKTRRSSEDRRARAATGEISCLQLHPASVAPLVDHLQRHAGPLFQSTTKMTRTYAVGPYLVTGQLGEITSIRDRDSPDIEFYPPNSFSSRRFDRRGRITGASSLERVAISMLRYVAASATTPSAWSEILPQPIARLGKTAEPRSFNRDDEV